MHVCLSTERSCSRYKMTQCLVVGYHLDNGLVARDTNHYRHYSQLCVYLCTTRHTYAGAHEQLEREHSQLKVDLTEAQETCQVRRWTVRLIP